jgi:hypothetical protein
MSNLNVNTLGQNIGTVENNSAFRGIIRQAAVNGQTTSTWNPRTGGTSKTVLKGTQTKILEYATQCQTQGFEYSVMGGHVWTIEITFPVDVIVNGINSEPPPIATWELSYQPFEKNLLELNDRGLIQNLSTLSKQRIEQKLKLPEEKSTYAPWGFDDVTHWAEATIAYNLKRAGVEGKQGWVHTLKKTIVVSNNADTTGLLLNPQWDGMVFLKDQLVSVYSTAEPNPLSRMPAVINVNMPVQTDATNWNGTTAPAVITEGYVMDKNGIISYIGWLQYPAEYQMISLLKCQISQHWVFNNWSAGPKWGLYDPVVASSEPDPSAGNGPLQIGGFNPS